MLVLSRKQGQSIEFPELDVVVQVIAVKGSRVQLGIEAPREITVIRPEKIDAAKSDTGETDNDRECAAGHLAEARRIREELSRVEAELAALAELADDQDSLIARRIAGDSIARLESIRRSLFVAMRKQRMEARPIGEFVKVRTEVLDQLRRRQPQPDAWSETDEGHTSCVRQLPSSYSVRSFAPASEVA